MENYDIVCDKHSYLSAKLSLISIVTLSIVVGFYVYFSYTDMVAFIDEQYKERSYSAIAMATMDLGDKASINDREYIKRICDKLIRIHPSVLSVSVYVTDGRGGMVKAAGSARNSAGSELQSHRAPSGAMNTIRWEEDITDKTGHTVEVSAPIYIKGKPEATLDMHMDLTSKDTAIRRHMLRALLYALAGLIALIPILYARFRREVFGPLRRLIEGARSVARGNLDERVNLQRNDELGKLSQEFDNMTEAIRQREEENVRELESIKERCNQAEIKSRTDFLTELDNHRSFQIQLEAELNRAGRLNVPVSLLFCDLDKFKVFNDINGHLLGDRALFEVAEIIKYSLRNYDVAARYGGEEFVVILPGTESDDALMVAERIRHNIELYNFTTKDGDGKMTISIGTSTFPNDATEKEALIAAADHAMYESKGRGGNVVTAFKPSSDFNPARAS